MVLVTTVSITNRIVDVGGWCGILILVPAREEPRLKSTAQICSRSVSVKRNGEKSLTGDGNAFSEGELRELSWIPLE